MYFREFLGVRDNESRLYLRKAVFAFPIVNICSKEDFFSRLQERVNCFLFQSNSFKKGENRPFHGKIP